MSPFDPRAITRRTLPTRHEPSGAVLVSLDGSRAGWRALEWAAGEASARGAALRIVRSVTVPLVPADPWQWPAGPSLGEAAYSAAREELAAAVIQSHAIDPQLVVTTDLRPGPSGSALLGDVGEGALLVVGRRRGIGSALGFGPSIAWGAVRRAGRPAAVVDLADTWERGPSAGRVLVAVDTAGDPSPVLDSAFRAAVRRRAGVTLLHAWDRSIIDDAIHQVLEPYRAAFPDIDVRHREVTSLRQAVAAEGHGVAVTIIAAPTGRWDLTGSIRAHRLVRAARGPVTLVPLSVESAR